MSEGELLSSKLCPLITNTNNSKIRENNSVHKDDT